MVAMASSNVNNAVAAANLDAAVGFALPARDARGRLVRLGPVLDEVLSAHDYPAPIARILSEALVLTALLGAMLKERSEERRVGKECRSWWAPDRQKKK